MSWFIYCLLAMTTTFAQQPPPRFNRIVFPMEPTITHDDGDGEEEQSMDMRTARKESAERLSPQRPLASSDINGNSPVAISVQDLTAKSDDFRLFPEQQPGMLINEGSRSLSAYSSGADSFLGTSPTLTRISSPFRQLRPFPFEQQPPVIVESVTGPEPEYPQIVMPDPPAQVVIPKYPVVNPPDFLPPPRPRPLPPAGNNETTKGYYAINFCDRSEFPDEKLGEYGLERVDYFIWNASCSDVFFQCSIGQTFQLKCPGEGQAFDKATTNCNFRHSVKVCPEYDHVMHCTIADTCTTNEFACCAEPQHCISMQKRCDGRNDCTDGEDENNCPSCRTDEFACVKSGRCIPAAQRCDAQADDCGDGTNADEIGCSKNSTCLGKFICGHSSLRSFDGVGEVACIDYTKHCDGHRDCPGGDDEVNCKRSEEAKYLLCENQKQSVTKQQWCDGKGDCADASDEKYCNR